jgi:signal peptidase I
LSITKQKLFVETTIALLKQGYTVRFRAPGHSMLPTIRDGETVSVEPVIASSIKRGDIILYWNHLGVIAHRVVRIERKASSTPRFFLRGDAMNALDAPVDPELILGRVISVERNGRSIKVSSGTAKVYRAARVCASAVKRRMRALTPARRLS